MNSIAYRGGCWPTRQQELLLRAALLEEREAIQAWEEWKSTFNIDEIDPGSYRLLPLLFYNLHAHGIDHPLLQKFKGLRRYTWYSNQIVLNRMTTLLRSFHNAGIKTLLLKGAALNVLYYEDCGLRPMDDFDLLVPTAQALSALHLLEKLNWTPKIIVPNKLRKIYTSFRHALEFKGGSGGDLDLHWHVLYTSLEANADDDFWDAAIPISIGDVPTRALNAADQLLHICAHGAWWNPLPPLRWVADAMVILRTAPEIDWERLIAQVQKNHLVLATREALGYLREELDAPLPPAILQRLKSIPVSKADRMIYKAQTCPERLRGPISHFWLCYAQSSRSENNAGLVRRLARFLRYLQWIWNIDYLWQVPLWATYKVMEKMCSKALRYKNGFKSKLSRK